MRPTWFRRAVVGAALALVTFAVPLGLATPPSAAAGLPRPVLVRTLDAALVDPTATVSLTVTKYLGAPTGTSDGRPLAAPPALPTLSGVTFDVYRVYTDAARTQRLDLTTNAGWATAADVAAYRPSPADFTNGQFTVGATTYYIGPPLRSVVTDSSGVATFTEPNGAGLYLVRENVSAGDTITAQPGGAVPADQISPAAPFFVTLPMTDPSTRDAWMYDVYVYPKNQRGTAALSVRDRGTTSTQPGYTYGAGADHAYDYVLRTGVNPGASGLGLYVVYDDLPAEATLERVGLALADGTPLAAGTDYVVYTAPDWGQAATTFTSGSTPSVAGGPVVAVVLTAAGRSTLEAAGQDIVTTYSVTAAARPADGVVTDRGAYVPSSGWWDANGTAGVDPQDPTTGLPAAPVGIASNTVETTFGDVVVTKTDAANGSALAGATFAVFADANADGTCAPAEVTDANRIGTTAATDAAGRTTFSGLQTSDYADGAAQPPVTYCLVETRAPAGYELRAAPDAFTIARAAAGTLATTSVTVPDQASDIVNKLPLTGGPGLALLSALGLALIAAGVGYYVLSSRRARANRGERGQPPAPTR